MRELLHADPLATLPPRMLEPTDEDTRTAGPMSRNDLSRISTDCFRLQGEIDRQTERFGPVWAVQAHHLCESFHGLVLALLTVGETD